MLSRTRRGLSWSAMREAWKSLWPPQGLFAVTLVLRWTQIVDEQTGGVLLAIGIPTCTVPHLVRRGKDDRSPLQWLAVAAVGVMALAVSIVPSLDALLPGRAYAEADIQAVGDAIPLPEALKGPVRLLVHASLRRRGDDFVAIRLTGATTPVEAEFERTVSHRKGAGGTQHLVARDAEFKYVSAEIPAGTRQRRVEKLVGGPAHAVRVAIYRPPLPVAYVVVAALVVLLAVALLRVRVPLHRAAGPMVDLATVFGLALSTLATPGYALGPAFVAVLIGIACAGVVDALSGLLPVRRGPNQTASRRPHRRGSR